MPRDFSRTLRVAEQVQRELADLIRSEIKDPRVGMPTRGSLISLRIKSASSR